jgi:hypothetical protein
MLMARKSTDYVQFKLRIRESLRRKIEKAAEKKAISANAEAVERIEETFREEERHEAWTKEMEERVDELNAQEREWRAELARREAAEKAAFRDSLVLNMMLESRHGSAHLLRTLARALGDNPEWAATAENKQAFADRLHRYIMNNDFKEPSE